MDYYQRNAKSLSTQYQSLVPESVHKTWLPNLPKRPGLALDIGAGSGRDANWLASQGWQVTAVEPCRALRELAPFHPQVQWLDDRLPTLCQLDTPGECLYQLILVSAVWMHLSPKEQEQSLLLLKSIMSPNGILVITWRNQANDTERQFYNVEVKQFTNAIITTSADEGEREDILWHCAVLRNNRDSLV
jgi:2-polyprenyl-3-methyl-5-hydroxy-6-metoxy-1,4-benzoquinol methylase